MSTLPGKLPVTAALALLFAGLLTAAWGLPPASVAVAAAAMAVCGASVLVYARGADAGAFPVFPLLMSFYAVCFVLPVFLFDYLWPSGGPKFVYRLVPNDPLSLIDAGILASVLAGVTLLAVAFLLGRRWMTPRLPRFALPRQFDDRRLIVLAWLLLAGHLLHIFVPAVQRLPSVGQFLTPAGYVAYAVLLLMWRDKRINGWHAAVVFCITLPAILVKKATGGLLTPLMLYGILIFLLLFAASARKALMLALAGGAFLLLCYGPTTVVREKLIVHPEFNGLSIAQKIDAVSGLLSHRHRDFERMKPLGSTGMVVRRLALLPLYAVVATKTPDEVPYWGGTTYKPALTSFVPRALWPGKPTETNGNAFGRRYDLITPAHLQMSVNIPWIVEMRANFGLAGVLVGMMLVGLLMALLDRFFNRREASSLEQGVGIAIIFPLVYQESNFSLMCGSLLPLTICLWLYFRLGLTWFPNLESKILAALGRPLR